MDNTTAHKASEYELEVKRTIPFHDAILETAIDVALTAVKEPKSWLDTGAGPGVLVMNAMKRSPATRFLVADPSGAMLGIARGRLTLPEKAAGHGGVADFIAAGSAELPDVGPLDVITAVQCHHYGDMGARERAVMRCRELLAPGGALVVFENVKAETDRGHAIQRARWAEWQRAQGRDTATVEWHLGREGTAFFPVRVSEHQALFRKVGFEVVELIWRAYGQAGFLAQRQ